MANRHKRKSGANSTLISGNPKVVSAAKSTTSGFKAGGKVSGAKSKMSFPKRARGGRTGSPFSSAKTSEKGNLTC